MDQLEKSISGLLTFHFNPPGDDAVQARDDDVHEDGVAQRPDISRQASLNVLTKPDDADRKDVDQVVEAAQDVLHGRRHVTEGPGFAGIHQIGQLVHDGKDVRLCKKITSCHLIC